MKVRDYWKKYQRQLLIGGGVLVVAVILSILMWATSLSQGARLREETAERELLSESSSEEELADVPLAFADIKGAVVSPGMYQIGDNTRLQDLIALAGGLTREAESRHLNLSLLIQDQMLVYVPFRGEESSSEDLEPLLPSNQSQTATVNLNTADLSDLQTLTGIGPKKAAAIIAYREETGSFKRIEELMEVSGIGEKTFEALKEELSIK